MLKNVAGIWFESKTAEDEYVVRTYDLGNGHREAVISRRSSGKKSLPNLLLAWAMTGGLWLTGMPPTRSSRRKSGKLISAALHVVQRLAFVVLSRCSRSILC